MFVRNRKYGGNQNDCQLKHRIASKDFFYFNNCLSFEANCTVFAYNKTKRFVGTTKMTLYGTTLINRPGHIDVQVIIIHF